MAKIDLRNSVTECAQSVKKENAGKYYNYAIKDCIKSIAAQKQQIFNEQIKTPPAGGVFNNGAYSVI